MISARQVARELGISRLTVKRYVEGAEPGQRRTPPRPQPVLERVRTRLDELVEAAPRWTGGKQRLTAARLWQLLREGLQRTSGPQTAAPPSTVLASSATRDAQAVATKKPATSIAAIPQAASRLAELAAIRAHGARPCAVRANRSRSSSESSSSSSGSELTPRDTAAGVATRSRIILMAATGATDVEM